MGKMYSNQTSGLRVVTGKIKTISEDRTIITIETSEYRDGSCLPLDIQVSSMVPFSEDYRIGFGATAVGYPKGKDAITAERVITGSETYETQDLAIIKGTVKFARMNEEKNADGSPRLKQDGTPRKPHYDITVPTKDGDRWVNHIIQVYQGTTREGQSSQFERVKKLFGDNYYENKDKRLGIVTFVTQSGSDYTTQRKSADGTEYTNFNCSHLGYKAMDVEFIDPRERTHGNTSRFTELKHDSSPGQDEPEGFPEYLEPEDELPFD